MITYILLILAIIAVLVVALYNGLIRLKNKAEESWSNIDTQLKRRYDLIPNLVETVKGYAAHESSTLEKVVQARTSAMNAKGFAEKQEAENVLSEALKSIFALSENYPDLKANQSFMDLQKNLSDTENQIQLSRNNYNNAVNELNTKIEIFPGNLIANMFGFTKREFFQINEEEKKNVKVSFEEKTKPEEQKPKETPKPE